MENVFLKEYPRPDLERPNWIALNGMWDFSASSDGSEEYDTKICVPFPPESRMSGVGRITGPEDTIRYRRTVKMRKEEGKRYILSFIAVDHECTVLVNGRAAGHHTGGYLPFSFDITDLMGDEKSEIKVIVTDPTDTMEIPRGKQTLRPGKIWYGPVSGIWQPVWIDVVPEHWITNMMVTPHMESGEFEFLLAADTATTETAVLEIDGKKAECPVGRPFRIRIGDPHPWSPEDPYLYDYSVTFHGETVKGYTAMRSFGIGTDDGGKKRLLLNGKPYFHHGVLDQGYWKDSLLTPPSDQAMINDILLMKSMGFNMLRKHIKIESPRWYWHCSRLGMLVWQDAVNGGGRYRPLTVQVPLVLGSHLDDTRHRKAFARENGEEKERWEEMLKGMVLHLYSQPCIAMWVIFNEGWGQFDSKRMTETVRRLDPTRTIDGTSGWQDQGDGDFRSLHVYFRPYRYKDDKKGRCVILSEFGGYGLDLDEEKSMYSYKETRDKDELTREMVKLYERDIIPAIPKGLAAAVWTQLSDVETEKNGLVTWDRKTVKADMDTLKELSERLKFK